MKLSLSFLSLALVAPLALASDRHVSPDSLAKRRHFGQVKRDHSDSYGGGGAYGAPAAPAPPPVSDDAMSSLSASSWSPWGAGSSMAHDSAIATSESPSPYDTANWAPSTTASASSWAAGGSGYGGYGGGAMDSCVQQCMASNSIAWPAASATSGGAASGTASAPPAASSSAVAGVGGYTGTLPANGSDLIAGPGEVVVAPKMGDLRMVPFNIAAKPGETVLFKWGAGPHTVTQSSAASICNASQEAGAFKSGMQNATFEFPVKVKDEKPVFYYCAVKMHCQMGMFGLINGQVSLNGNASFGNYMKTWAKKSAENQKMWDETVKITIDFPDAASWGDDLSTDQFEDWALPMAMESTLMTRQYFALNAKALAATNGTSSSGNSSSAPTSVYGAAAPSASDPAAADPSAADSTAAAQASGSTSAAPREVGASFAGGFLGALGVALLLESL
ncbi:hypothetical protein DMC30DRAFT_290632 [Rhodotorula diobovata]|uniref:Blue (type 1) copper domain-containing protein n=1 Tax=Rhodotorula diobovata TaxID=5288 RepID=A0A5C5FUP5_9BASI|nr:hypothetical protein DMC30DRAFT_290632 [Rhodotorula diobovata]